MLNICLGKRIFLRGTSKKIGLNRCESQTYNKTIYNPKVFEENRKNDRFFVEFLNIEVNLSHLNTQWNKSFPKAKM